MFEIWGGALVNNILQCSDNISFWESYINVIGAKRPIPYLGLWVFIDRF